MTAYLYEAGEEWRISLAPEVDAAYWRGKGITIDTVRQYRSIALAMRDWRQLTKQGRADWKWGWRRTERARTDRNAIGSRADEWRMLTLMEGEDARQTPEGTDALFVRRVGGGSWQSCVALWRAWRPLLAGRTLLLHEVKRLLSVRWAGDAVQGTDDVLSQQSIRRVLQVGILKQEVHVRSAIHMHGGQASWYCARCYVRRDQLVPSECARCGGSCYYCDNCLLLGRSSSCEPLLKFMIPAERAVGDDERVMCQKHDDTTLTPAQQRAAEQAVMFVQRGQERAMLMWAVTGAGKTEMTFGVVAEVLCRGGHVAIATPRKDVVNELTPRFRRAFPDVRIVKLHGDSGQTWQDGQLVIATTHQLLRKYRTFDLIIVDEVDAFPYRHNDSLKAGIDRALKENGQQLWLTATPPRSWQKAFRRGDLPGVTIPARYHGYALPEPVITLERRLWDRVSRHKVIPSVVGFFDHVRLVNGQAYVFVPSLSHLTPVLKWMNVHVQGMRAAGVSSRDEARTEKVVRFREKQYDCLVTTTILERGVTVENAHVLVLQADHPIFDEAALVQMSGRSGRSASFPNGRVNWIATENTREQRRAVQHIRGMNREAREHGWFHHDRA